jgi:cytochrome b561
MTTVAAIKYDGTTRCLHAALASGVVIQLLLSAVMTVPSGPGMGMRDWHREAFELHAKVGLFVTAVCICHWIWIFLPRAKPGYLHLFPWIRHESRLALRQIFASLSSPHELGPLIGTVHGLGFLAVTGSMVCGVTNYFGYFLNFPIPRMVLHGVGMAHITFGYLIWVFVFGHTTMAVVHRARK